MSKQPQQKKKPEAKPEIPSDRYEETDENWENILKDDDVDPEYGEFDNGPSGRNSSNWQDVQDGFSSSGRGNVLHRGKNGLSRSYRTKNKLQGKNLLPDEEEESFEDPKRWRTPMGDW